MSAIAKYLLCNKIQSAMTTEREMCVLLRSTFPNLFRGQSTLSCVDKDAALEALDALTELRSDTDQLLICLRKEIQDEHDIAHEEAIRDTQQLSTNWR